jgi:hypothetical protein
MNSGASSIFANGLLTEYFKRVILASGQTFLLLHQQ